MPASRVIFGGGEAGALMRAKDWSATALGSPQTWPQSLQSALSICLGSNFPIAIYWGPDLVLLYNDAWAPILGSKHPWALGRPGQEVWPELWDTIGPMFAHVFATGEASGSMNQMLGMHRFGFVEECYFDFTFSPVRSEAGRVDGIFNAAIETTTRVLSERRTRLLRDLGEATADANTMDEAWQRALPALESNLRDLPFSLLYRVEKNNGEIVYHLVATTGLEHDFSELSQTAMPWPLAAHITAGRALTLENLSAQTVRPMPSGGWPEPTERARVLPLASAGGDIFAVLVVGISPRLAFDSEYQIFIERVGSALTAAMLRAQTIASERQRNEALAELDRAKTLFFSNVSHELRTPLTLILGPLEDLLRSETSLPNADARNALEVAHRNSLRLLRLVNTLLDFSRIEAGKVQAAYEPIDLSLFTAELASVFRAAADKAGIALTLECAPMPRPILVDREMWEKIVFNLLSNAFKYTLHGEIKVSVHARTNDVALQVSDTGTGIPTAALPHLFERFYRVPNATGRTHEGTGIGLALVHELVKLHDGRIDVASEVGKGTTFTVTIPFARTQLSNTQASVRTSARTLAQQTVAADMFIEEALRWIPDSGDDALAAILTTATHERGTVVLADDNSDMRAYLKKLLAQHFNVLSAGDGESAFALIKQHMPDLVLTDIMMPRLDGVSLLRRMRADSSIADIPIILLSARTGEEALVEGLDAGADDYLVKPFSARELLARVTSHIKLFHLRKQTQLALSQAENTRWQALEALNRQLRAQSDQLQQLFEKAPGFMVVLRGNRYEIELMNGAYARLVGHRSMLGKPLLEALPELTDQPFPQLLDRVLSTGEPYIGKAMPIMLQRSDGVALEERFLDFVYQPLSNADGVNTSIFVEGYDVTERILAERALMETNRRKDEFLATLAHELRNPLAALSAAAQLLARAADKPAIVAVAREALSRQVEHMARLLDDLLDVSRITHGRLQLRNEKHNVLESIAAAVETTKPQFDNKSHQLHIATPTEPLYVDGDRVRLTQLFTNLLANAAKYTDPGGQIQIAITARDDAVEISIADNGIGISAEMLPEVFEMFSQAQPALQRSEGGLGIGLSLVRGLVHLHGGEVEAKSAGPHQGSEFTVRLPRVQLTPAAARPPKSVSARDLKQSGFKILVADDNVDSASSWAMLLTLSGHEVRTAHDGAAAVAIATEMRPHLALLDVGMPELNGYEVARRIRSEPWGEHITLVALTGWGHDNDKQEAKNAGFDHHFTKPLDMSEFDALLSQKLREFETAS